MRIYYLERALDIHEITWVEEAFASEGKIEQIRIPHVLPAPNANGSYMGRPLFDNEVIEGNLKKSGILKDYGKQVSIVIPKDMHWYAALGEAIYKLTGYYPYLIQTHDHREYINNPGEIRIIDMHGLMDLKNDIDDA